MADNGVTCTISRSGNVRDNAVMASFFLALETGRMARTIRCPQNQAKAEVFDSIERFYNSDRRHSILGYLSPIDF